MRKMSRKNGVKLTVAVCMATLIAGSVIGCSSKETDNKDDNQVTTTVEDVTTEEPTTEETTTKEVKKEPTQEIVFDKNGALEVYYHCNTYSNSVNFFDFDMDGKKEKIEVVCDHISDGGLGVYKYTVTVNENVIYEKENEHISVNIADIDANDSLLELIINTQSNDDKDEFEIFHITSDEVVSVTETVDDNHLSYSTEGDGKLEIRFDVSNRALGCFFLNDTLVLKDHKLVRESTDKIFIVDDSSMKNVYKLEGSVDVYPDTEFQGNPIELKKGDEIKIKRVSVSDYENLECWQLEIEAVEVIHNGEVIGWIDVKGDKELFDVNTVPVWD